jgi:RHS repeat-associated protein
MAALRDSRRIANANPLTGFVTHYVYDASGQLIAEMDGATGAAIREYIWLGGLPVGYVDRLGAGGASRLFFVHADHLARPQKISDSARTVVWDGVFAPFGEIHAVSGSIVNILMFPGQVYDPETGLSQNWRRDYDSNIGRYMQSDPIGLEGGFNTYAYANANPVTITDPTGEMGLGGAGIGVAIGILTDEDGCYTAQELVRDAVLGALGDIGIRAFALGLQELRIFARMGALLRGARGMQGLRARGGTGGGGYGGGGLGLGGGSGGGLGGSGRASSGGGGNSSASDFIVSSSGSAVESSLASRWAQGTFGNVVKSMEYHFAKHGAGRTLKQYTDDAAAFFAKNKGQAQWGTWNPKWAPSYRLKVGDKGGYFTSDGRILTYWD